MKKLSATKTLAFLAVAIITLSIILGIISIFPITTGNTQTNVIINDEFNLTPNQVRRQGLGSFKGGENITLLVQTPANYPKNFSIVTYSGLRFQNITNQNINYSFTAGADYYEAIFYSNVSDTSPVLFTVTVQQPQVLTLSAWLTEPAKMLFIFGLGLALALMLKNARTNQSNKQSSKPSLPFISIGSRHRILALVILSLALWLILLSLNANPFATFENWYTDHARHAYTASLFLKDGFSVFNQPLGTLASQDNSSFKFITWPEMPHLYPIGSILIFLPFGALLQNGFDPSLIYKLEIATFLVFAHVCLYFFLKLFLKKELEPTWKLVGIYIIYVTLIIYAADGMFDSIAFLFSLFAVTMFLTERYDYFFLLIGASIFFKYQAGIFLLPIIAVGILKLIRQNNFTGLLRNKAVIAGLALVCTSVFTAYLSAPYLIETRPQLIMNGVNAFSPNAQIPWALQSLSVLITLVATLVYAFYMRHRNLFLSLSSLFLLLPSFMLPYFQNWYLPFIFIYILIPQTKRHLEATMLWLIFMMAVLSFGGSAFNPMQIIDNFRTTFGI